ncbi:MAG: hypothetical protein ACYSWW_00270 [Planctomycetota bacterium]|jgi:hypothetical protein
MNDDNGREQSSKQIASQPAGKDAMQQNNEIPQFDLAEQIMAEQRKNASVRRKGPGKKVRAPKENRNVEPLGHTIKLQPALPEQEQILAEIVARDIEKLCKGNARNPQTSGF